MESNWPVVYTAGTPWSGPGSFESYAAAVEAAMQQRFGRGVARIGRGDSFLIQIARGITFHPSPPPAEIGAHYSPPVRLLLASNAGAGLGDALMLAAVGRAVASGPKLFRPSPRECEPLEQVEVGLTAAEITLPFPVCVVEFPPDYAANRIVPSPNDGSLIRPVFAVALEENGVVVVLIALSEKPGGRDFDTTGLPVSRSTVEEVIGRADERGTRFVPFLRVVLNFLMLAAGGHRLVGPANPAQARTLRERIKRARKERDKDKLENLRTRLRRLPSVFALAQEISLYDREQPPAEPNPDADGTPKRPHWRKGHWRRVAVGAGRAERKWACIKPVLVNGHLLPE